MRAAVRRWWRARFKREASWACFGGMLQAIVADKALRGRWKLTDLALSRAPKDLEIKESEASATSVALQRASPVPFVRHDERMRSPGRDQWRKRSIHSSPDQKADCSQRRSAIQRRVPTVSAK